MYERFEIRYFILYTIEIMDILIDESLNITGIDSVFEFKSNLKSWKADGRPFHCIAYSLEGVVDHFFGNKILTHKPGVIFYIPAQTNFLASTTCPFIHSIAIHFYIHEHTVLEHATYPIEKNKRLEFIFQDVLKRYFRKEPAWQLRVTQALYDIIATLVELQNQKMPNSRLRKDLDSVIEQIHKNIANSDFSVEGAARSFRVTRTHFGRLFKRAYGVTPIEYIQKKRLELAKDLLRASFFNISEISSQCGFSDLYYFSKVFKKETGLSPSAYRKNR